MRIKRSAIIIYGSAKGKKGMKNNKLTDYKNQRYLEIMRELVDEYDEIIIADKDDNYLYEAKDEKENEERIIRCIYSTLKSIKNDKVLIISSNMPLINKTLINYMGRMKFNEDILIPYVDEKLQGLCAIYDKKILKDLQYIIESKKVSFSNLFNNVSVRYVFPEDKNMFISVDKLEKYITYLYISK